MSDLKSIVEQKLENKQKKFKIGRCQSNDFDKLKYRKMYKGMHIFLLKKVNRFEADQQEAALICTFDGDARCLNKQKGGGPIGSSLTHVIYLAVEM